MRYSLILLVVVLILILSFRSVVGGSNDEVTGLFSTFRPNKKSGDIVGAEIHIVPDPIGYSAIVQASEGAPGFPEVVTLSVRGNTIEFTIPPNSASGFPPGRYVGRITREYLLLDGPTESLRKYKMPRKKRYWQTVHAGSCLASIEGTSGWKQVASKEYLELRRGKDTLKVFCTSREEPVSDMDLLLAAKVEEPGEGYCCNAFGSFSGFESREADGHQEWWLRKDKYIVHIISSRTVPEWSAGADVETVINQLTIK